MEEAVHDGTGTIQEKTEQVTKKGDKFWKFKIDEKTYSIFEYKAGELVKTGDKVKMVWTESEGQGKFGPVTYRNLRSIFKADESNTDTTPSAHNGDSPKATGGGGLSPDTDRRIVRQNVLRTAVMAIQSLDVKAGKTEIKEVASEFEEWIYREV